VNALLAESPRLLVIGAGSIGCRHMRNLAAAGAQVTCTDPNADAARAAAQATDGAVLAFDLDRLGGFDGIVVASPTRFHLEQASAALATGACVMVEKPLADDLGGVDTLVAAGGDRLMVGFNLRLHEPIRQLVRIVADGRIGRPVSFRLWFGSWLPDWRPDVDYRQTYSARADLGGGVLNDAIHEIDLAVWLAGHDLDVVAALVARVGPLEIDVEDTVRALLRTGAGVPVEIALDYLSRTYRRGIEVIGEEGTIRLDWARQVLEIECAGGRETMAADTPVAISYELEARAFLSLLGGAAPPVDGVAGVVSLRLVAAIREAASK
jgi:predicted dehydrogenase